MTSSQPDHAVERSKESDLLIRDDNRITGVAEMARPATTTRDRESDNKGGAIGDEEKKSMVMKRPYYVAATMATINQRGRGLLRDYKSGLQIELAEYTSIKMIDDVTTTSVPNDRIGDRNGGRIRQQEDVR